MFTCTVFHVTQAVGKWLSPGTYASWDNVKMILCAYIHPSGHEGSYKPDKSIFQDRVRVYEHTNITNPFSNTLLGYRKIGEVTECFTGSFSPEEVKTSKRLSFQRYKSGQVRDMHYTHLPDKSNSPRGVLLSHVDEPRF